jgi:hypothetical protein
LIWRRDGAANLNPRETLPESIGAINGDSAGKNRDYANSRCAFIPRKPSPEVIGRNHRHGGMAASLSRDAG